MPEVRKQAISLRVGVGDLRKVKKLAQRLGVRDSDVVRFALKTMLARMAPLCDSGVRGRALLPVLIEDGSDLLHHFDLDSARLDQIVNDGVDADQAIDTNDLALIAMAGTHQAYANLRLLKQPSGLGIETPHLVQPDNGLNGNLRGYLYAKYGELDCP